MRNLVQLLPERTQTQVDKALEPVGRFLVRQLGHEALMQCVQNLVRFLSREVGNRSVDHHPKDVGDVVAMLSQRDKSLCSSFLKLSITIGHVVLLMKQAVYHRFCDSDWSFVWLSGRGLAQNVAKIKVEKLCFAGYHQVFEVSVPDCKDVGCNRIPYV